MSEQWMVGVQDRGMGRSTFAVCAEDGSPVPMTAENVTKMAAAPETTESLAEVLNLAEKWGPEPSYRTPEERAILNRAKTALSKSGAP